MSVLMLTTMNSWVYAADSAVEAPAAEPAPAVEATPAAEPAPAVEPAPAEEPAPTETPQETPAVTPAVTPEAEPTEAPSEPAPQADSTKEAVPADSQPQSTASAVSGPESASATPAPTPEVKYVTSFTVTSHNVTVTATTTDAAKFPEGTQLHVDYAAPGSALYQSTIGTVEQSLGIAGDETRSAEGVVYDIYFTYNGNRIEPDDAVSVTMNFASPVASDLPEGSSMENSCVMHVTGGGAENVGASVGTTSEGAVTDASFRSDSFSPYFVGGVRRAPGNTTDTQSGNVSSNLNDFTTSVSIDAKEDASGNYVVEKGVAYKIHLTFQEDDESNGKQFGNPLTYTLPAGFHDIDHSFEDFAITVSNPNGSSYTVSGNKVSLDNGTLTVTFNESDPNWPHLEKARNTQFHLTLKGTFDDSAKELDWGNGKKTSLSVDTSGSLTTVKQANYDRSDGKVHYTVTVTSHGYNTNVIVKDSLTGTALTYDQHVTSSVTGGKVKSQTERGFEYVIPEMTDGQTATLTYAASVNFDALGGGQGTEEQVGNSVVTTSDQQPNSEPVQENWTNKIDYLSISKQAGAASDGTVSGHKTIPWTVTYNADRKGSAAGRTITDSIADTSKNILKYSGDGIKIAVTDASGNVVRTDNVSWANVGVTDPASTSSWHYTIPESDKGKAYQYTVSYTTDADLTSVVTNTSVSNTVQDDKGHNGGASANVEPGPDGKIGVTKTAGSHDNEKISWTVTLTVPKTGLKTAQMIDYLPTQYVAGANLYDEWDAATVKVEGLLDGEDMVQDTAASDQTKAVYTFYQDKAHTMTGLKGGDKVRTIIVTFSTKINQDWLEKADQSYMMTHENKVDFVGNGQTVSSSDKVKVTKREIAKSMDQSQTVTIDGKTYPAWHFVIMMKGAAAEDFDVTDTFDARLRYVKPDETVPGLYIGNAGKLTDADGNPYVWNAPVLSADVEDSKVVFHVTKEDVEKFNDIAELHISYWLIPKDEASLKAIMQEAAANGGKTSLTNTASWSGDSAEASATYEYPGLSKKLLTDQSKLKTTDGTQPVAAYEIDANPAGVQMGDGTTLVVRDTMSPNQVLNPQSVSITPSEGSSYQVEKGDDGGQVLTFMIPDKTPVKIVYSATVTGGNGSQTLKNTAELAGYKSSSEHSASKSSSAGGSATNYAVTVFKYEEGDLTQKLSGCTFELHMADSTEDAAWKGSGKQFTTGNDGTVIVESTEGSVWGLKPDRNYYLIEVKAPEGYQLDKAKHFFSISEDGTIDETKNVYMNGATIAVSDKKEEQTPDNGSLEIVKTTSGATTPAGTTFTISGPNGYKVEKKYSEFTDGKLKLDNLPVGEYTVTENTGSAAVENYSLSVTGNGGKAQVVKGETATVTIKNTYSQEEGSLEIVKTTSGAETPADTIFTIIGPNGYKVEKKYSEFTDGKLTLENLPVGEYTVTENTGSAAVTNYTLTVSGDNGKVTTVKKDETTTVSITNTYSKEVGSLEIEKTTSGDVATPADTTFTIAGPNKYSNTVKYSEFTDGKLTLEKLPVGEYTVTENTDSAKVANYTLNVTGNGGKAQVAKDKTATVTIKNEYSRDKGSLKITKSTEGGVKTPEKTEFKITGPDGVDQTYHYSDFTNGVLMVNDLPTGTYTVKELTDTADVKNYTLTVTGNSQNAVVTKDSTPSVKITNHYDKKTGGLTVSKTVVGGDKAKAFNFTVTLDDKTISGTYGGMTFEKGVATFQLKDGEEKKADGLPFGTGYEVTEAPAAGYTQAVTGEKGAIVPDSTLTAAFINTYGTKAASVALGGEKTLQGYPDNAKKPTFRFVLKDKEKTIGTATTEGQGNFTFDTLTFEKEGTYEYTVSEQAGTADGITYDQTVYTVTVTVTDDKAGQLTAKAAVKDQNGKEADTDELNFINKYKAAPVEATLTARKTLNGAVPADKAFTFTLTDATDEEHLKTLQTAANDGKGIVTFKTLTYNQPGEYHYQITENTAAVGSVVTDQHVWNAQVSVTDDGTGKLKAEVIYGKDRKEAPEFKNTLTLKTSKTDLTSGAEVKGAKISVYNADGKAVTSWTSDGTEHDFGPSLEAGRTYTIVEECAPAGYDYVNTINLSVGRDGKMTVTGTEGDFTYDEKTGKLTIQDKKLDVKVDKTDTTGDKKVPGATIEVVDKETGKTVDTWTSDGKGPHDIGDKLEAGKIYTLKETGAPQGYAYTADVTFKVEKDGTLTDENGKKIDGKTVLVKDEALTVKIDKTDITGDKEVPGAMIEVVEKETGRTVETWTSDGKGPHGIGGKLESGRTYTLKETGAPQGYAYTTDVTFKVEKDGTLTDENGKKIDGNTVLVKDEALSLKVSKTDLTSGAEVKGAKITVYDVDGKAVMSWTSDGTEHDFGPSLEAGRTYTIAEDGAPAGYAYVNKISLSVGQDGKMTVTGTEGSFTYDEKTGVLTIQDEKLNYQVEKVGPDGKPLSGAVLKATDSDGKEVDRWTSDGKAHALNTSAMEAGRMYTLTEETAPSGYQTISPIGFELAKDGSLILNGKTYPNGSTIRITDQKVTVSKPTTPTTPTTGKTGNVKTGDTSNAALPLAAGSLALLAIALILFDRKRRQA